VRNFSPAAGFDLFQFGDPRRFGVVGKVESKTIPEPGGDTRLLFLKA